jgi:hypothetical protein
MSASGNGYTLACDLGRWIATDVNYMKVALGGHIGVGEVSGAQTGVPAYNLIPFELGGFGRVLFFNRLWLGGLVGMHADSLSQSGIDSTNFGMSLGLEVGLDALILGPYRFGLYARFETEPIGGVGYSAVSIGLEIGR